MLLPNKHLSVSDSLVGLGADIILELRRGEKNIDELCERISKSKNSSRNLNLTHNEVILATDVLYALGLLRLTQESKLILCA